MINLIAENLAPIMFVTMLAMLVIGYPVAFTLSAVGLGFYAIGVQLSQHSAELNLSWSLLSSHPDRVFGIMSNETLLAIPFFTFMGLLLERSGMAEDLLEAVGELFGTLPGGLAYAVILVGALLSATTGVVSASVIAMGLISLPIMMRYGYSSGLASGTIVASGTLAQIVPPSIVLIVMADQLGQSVGDMYHAALVPGTMVIGLYCLYVFVVGVLRPDMTPPLPKESRGHSGGYLSLVLALSAMVAAYFLLHDVFLTFVGPENRIVLSALIPVIVIVSVCLLQNAVGMHVLSPLASKVILSLAPALTLIFLVLGTIFLGIATPTEGGAMGAVGALFLTTAKRKFSWHILFSALHSTAILSAFVMFILIGARVFGLTFFAINGNTWVEDLLSSLPGGINGFLLFVTVTIFILGCFLDFFEIAFVVIPLLVPAAVVLDIDLVWFGILISLNLAVSFLTPPFGFSLFFLRSVAPSTDKYDKATGTTQKAIRTGEIYRGAVPFVLIQLMVIGLVIMFPQLVLHYKSEPQMLDVRPPSVNLDGIGNLNF
ncbi:TRAP transporter large permease [Roseovarius amoyensis]|uniref:TRAP transporter large permease n=1 Tax=Roseovarius amoyensis TaxID=2211448 RepID=UPI000DBE1962|nr:TRAP transporter large permease subunit [Roseovarius amoyensis]